MGEGNIPTGFPDFSNVIVGSMICTNPNDWEMKEYGIGPGTPFAVYSNVQGADPHMQMGTVQVHLPDGQYDPISLSKSITDKFQYLDPKVYNGQTTMISSSQFLRKTDVNTFFYAVGTDPTEEVGYTYDVTTPYWYGASQVSIGYGEEADLGNIFAFKFMHTPFISNNELAIKSVKDGGKFYIISQQSGIFLTSISPKSFFESLGFNINDLLINLVTKNGVKHIDKVAELDRVTTKGYSGIQSLFPDGNRVVGNPPPAPGYIATSNTIGLIANGRELDDTGHMLIELLFSATGQQFMFNGGSLNHIFGIVSKQYIQDGYITSFNDASINYVHEGRPFNLQNVQVKILNPFTKQPIANLGEKSTIYLQLNKMLKNKPVEDDK
jgi:hypothetical protein